MHFCNHPTFISNVFQLVSGMFKLSFLLETACMQFCLFPGYQYLYPTMLFLKCQKKLIFARKHHILSKLQDLGDIVSSNATYLLHSTTDHDRAEQDSGEPEVGNMAHKRMANARVKMGFASGGNTHGRSPLAVTLRDFRPRLEAMQALCSEVISHFVYQNLKSLRTNNSTCLCSKS